MTKVIDLSIEIQRYLLIESDLRSEVLGLLKQKERYILDSDDISIRYIELQVFELFEKIKQTNKINLCFFKQLFLLKNKKTDYFNYFIVLDFILDCDSYNISIFNKIKDLKSLIKDQNKTNKHLVFDGICKNSASEKNMYLNKKPSVSHKLKLMTCEKFEKKRFF